MMPSPAKVVPFSETSLDPPVHGFLHHPPGRLKDAIVFTHGAGGNARGSLLVSLAEAFAAAGFAFLRCDLPFRQSRSFGPPRPAEAARDREGLRNAATAMRNLVPGRLFLGGQSYGGRQATMLCAEDPGVADGLLLTSYPLHPPGKADQPRTAHLPQLRTPALFVEGTRDPFATIGEITEALKLIPARTALLTVEGVGHDLGFGKKSHSEDLTSSIVAEFLKLVG